MVQSLDLKTLSEWEVLPALPTAVAYGVFVNDGDELVLVNTAYGNLLRFNENNRTFSIIQGQALPVGGNGTPALAVDDSSLYGCL